MVASENWRDEFLVLMSTGERVRKSLKKTHSDISVISQQQKVMNKLLNTCILAI